MSFFLLVCRLVSRFLHSLCYGSHTSCSGPKNNQEGQCHDTTKPLSLISFLVNPTLSWTPRGTTCLPRGTAQIVLFSIGIYFLFSACLTSDLRNRLPRITISLQPSPVTRTTIYR